MATQQRRVLHLAASVEAPDAPGSTIEWARQIDHERWAPSIVTTEPAPNTGLAECERYADEVWDLADLMPGGSFPEFIVTLIESREIEVLHIFDSRLGYDLLPDIACLPHPPVVCARMDERRDGRGYVRYVTRRYGNLVDAFSASSESMKEAIVAEEIPASRIEVIPTGEADEAPGAARRHEALYERLLAARPASSRWRNSTPGGDTDDAKEDRAEAEPPRPPLELPRTPPPERSIGIIVPCFRHGIFLGECIESIKAQTLAPAQVVVVDDGSDDPETIAAIEELERDPEIEVLRQPSNLGPSAARNRALEALETNYVLPIDADDKLFPDALEQMVARLEAAPPNTGFVYPHAQHCGSRHDFVRLPAYNLWLLMKENYCPAPALFDRRVFGEDGVSYAEEIVVGHEDWDLILRLAERGVVGVHADGPTFLYRRQGFSRVNAMDYGPEDFHEAIERRHPGLYERKEEIKTAWAPAVSLILLDQGEEWQGADLAALPEQTCGDFEVLARRPLAEGVRSVDAPSATAADWLQAALDSARGRWICVIAPGTTALDNRTFVERLIYALAQPSQRSVLALGVSPESQRHFLAQLDDQERLAASPVGVAFERRAAIALPDVRLPGTAHPLEEIVLALQATEPVQWRLLPGPGPEPALADGEPRSLRFDFDRTVDRSVFATRDLVAHQDPWLSRLDAEKGRRWEESADWTPPGTRQLCRHVAHSGGHRIIADHRSPPPGYTLEFDLGAMHVNASPGMKRLVHSNDSFELIDDQNMLDEGRHGLGYVQQEQLPQLERLELRRMRDGGQMILVAGSRDPLFDETEPVADFGWLEAFPLNPQNPVLDAGPWRPIPLWRSAEANGRRHLYAAGPRPGPDAVELGSLYPLASDSLVSLGLRSDGRLTTDATSPGRASRDPRRLVRWLAAGEGAGIERLSHLALNSRTRRLAEGTGAPLGGLRPEGGPDLFPLFSTTHLVTGDQLVTCSLGEALDRGYQQDGVLGYIHVASGDPHDLGAGRG
jgi:hypothetical protein